MAASMETRESSRVNTKINKTISSDCPAKRSKELLVIENNAVSRDDHIANLLGKQSKKSCDKPIMKTHRLPQNSVLNNVMSFLPQLRKANDEITEAIAGGANYDIEDVDEADQVIEMNLTLLEQEADTGVESGSDSSSDSEIETENDIRKPEPRKGIIEEMDPATATLNKSSSSS